MPRATLKRKTAARANVERSGRPLQARALIGYQADLAHLGRLRRACLEDMRLSTPTYTKVIRAIQTIEEILRRVPKLAAVPKNGKRAPS